MVSIIILTYNSAKYIDGLLKSLSDFARGQEIIIVDNKSSDDTLPLIKKNKTKKRVIETGANLGFARGINAGAAKATGDYLLFINPDAKFESGTLEDMISVFDNNPSAGIVGGKLVNSDGNSEKSAGNFFGLIPSLLIAAGMDEIAGIRISPKKETKVDFVSGGFMMVKKRVFEEIGGFDQNFFMYVEDMELCFRAKLAGYTTYFSPVVTISHVGQGSGSRGFAVKNIIRGIIYFHKKHGTAFSYFIVKFVFMAKAFILVLVGKILNNKYLSETYLPVLKQ